MKKYTIGLDLGTSSVKGILFDGKTVVASHGAKFEYKKSEIAPGVSYIGFDADAFYNTIAHVLKSLAKKSPADIDGVAFASASGNTLLCDENGDPLMDAYSWTNPAFSHEVKAVLGAFSPTYIRDIGGWQFFDTFPLAHLSHIKVHAPSLLEKAATVCMTTEFVLHRLTGKWAIDRSTATPFYLAEQKTGKWHKPFLNAFGITEAQLMTIGKVGDLLGTILPTRTKETGLKETTKVYLGSFDHPSGARANGVCEEGDLLLSCGTSWVEFFPHHDRDLLLANRMLCDPFLMDNGLYGFMASIPCISDKIRYYLEKWVDNSPQKYRTFDSLAEKAPMGANGLRIRLLEDEARDLGAYTKADICRALMEAPAYMLKENLMALTKLGITFRRVFMAGGPTNSPIWCKIIQQIIDLPITVTYGVNSGAVGAAMLANR